MTASEKGHSQKTREMDHQVNGTQIHRVVETSILIQVGEPQQEHVSLIYLIAICAMNAAYGIFVQLPAVLLQVGST